MRSRLTAALLASAIASASFAVPGTASARSDFAITFRTGDVAFAYRDGWWDRYHHFHHWKHRERNWYRAHYRTSYHDWGHNRYRNHGWHDMDYRPH